MPTTKPEYQLECKHAVLTYDFLSKESEKLCQKMANKADAVLNRVGGIMNEGERVSSIRDDIRLLTLHFNATTDQKRKRRIQKTIEHLYRKIEDPETVFY